MNALKRYLSAKRYQAKLNLLAKVHREVAPVIEILRKAESILNGEQETRGIENQGFTFDLSKYNVSYRMIEKPRMDTDLAAVNDDWQSLRVAAMGQAESEVKPILA